ncbi:MAG: DUF1682 domain-containing protein [Lachnospiraceae bacterium]|nr:DUF1682 domain-containing protein [Lachnospiraceae bacterium]
MAITGVNNYTTYANYYTQTKPKNSSENAKNAAEQQSAEKTYSNTREYRNYLTQKYNCLKSTEYSVEINSSLLSKALGDEKTSEWLEYNLSLIPENVEKIKSTQAARGCKVLSCSIKINGYDSMTAETCVTDEVEPETEKAREELKEKLKKIREEKKAEERKIEDEKLEEQRLDENIKMPFDSGMVIADNMMKRNGFDQRI